mmetsp:Transcript_11480/g.27826  ORF Transcript_11480/g.27826 Transcript_11480/m.27826 type:complete len:343 (-) Transcript_11480:471-1499(-)
MHPPPNKPTAHTFPTQLVSHKVLPHDKHPPTSPMCPLGSNPPPNSRKLFAPLRRRRLGSNNFPPARQNTPTDRVHPHPRARQHPPPQPPAVHNMLHPRRKSVKHRPHHPPKCHLAPRPLKACLLPPLLSSPKNRCPPPTQAKPKHIRSPQASSPSPKPPHPHRPVHTPPPASEAPHQKRPHPLAQKLANRPPNTHNHLRIRPPHVKRSVHAAHRPSLSRLHNLPPHQSTLLHSIPPHLKRSHKPLPRPPTNHPPAHIRKPPLFRQTFPPRRNRPRRHPIRHPPNNLAPDPLHPRPPLSLRLPRTKAPPNNNLGPLPKCRPKRHTHPPDPHHTLHPPRHGLPK